MIKIFRKIRYGLVEKNKTGKYLKYAIGEIVLVVIGILIALQINNWNEIQKKEKLKISYKISLINDLSLDILKLNELITKNYSELETLNNQKKRFLGEDSPVDTLIKIARTEFDPELNTRFQYNRNTFNTLIATGNIDLFDESLNKKLMSLISLQDLERENSNYYTEIYSNKISRYSDNYPVSGHQNSNIVNLIWTNLDELKFASSFISATDIKGYAHYRFINAIENVKEEATLLIEQINNNY
ncbi:MAG: DUF6090 family protein [Psychroserpens sp.]|uniref:DUF6090 family protein n=1 Tax=Psychroserpens sp. TaxID=2020870 RepID=UPI0030023813